MPPPCTRRCPRRPTAVHRQPWTDMADGAAEPASSRAADTRNNRQPSPVMDGDAALAFGAPVCPAICVRGGRRAPERPCSRGQAAPAHGYGQRTLDVSLETTRTLQVCRLRPPSSEPHSRPRSLCGGSLRGSPLALSSRRSSCFCARPAAIVKPPGAHPRCHVRQLRRVVSRGAHHNGGAPRERALDAGRQERGEAWGRR